MGYESCHDGSLPDGAHDDECMAAERAAMLRGDDLARAIHDPEDCEECLAARPAVLSDCRCGNCCRELLIEVSELDVRREPRIRERCSPIRGANDEPVGYLLNARDGPCVFLDRLTNLCTIYATRPLVCRLFNCDQSSCRPSGGTDVPEQLSSAQELWQHESSGQAPEGPTG